MAKYRKKPVVIEATPWFLNGDHPRDYEKTLDDWDEYGNPLPPITPEHRKARNWEGDVVRYYRTPEVSWDVRCKHCTHIMHVHGWIDTLEGGHIVCPGDWIITGVEGEYYPCKPDIFEKTYERVEE